MRASGDKLLICADKPGNSLEHVLYKCPETRKKYFRASREEQQMLPDMYAQLMAEHTYMPITYVYHNGIRGRSFSCVYGDPEYRPGADRQFVDVLNLFRYSYDDNITMSPELMTDIIRTCDCSTCGQTHRPYTYVLFLVSGDSSQFWRGDVNGTITAVNISIDSEPVFYHTH